MRNLNLLFYKDYYEKIEQYKILVDKDKPQKGTLYDKDLDKKNKDIFNAEFTEADYSEWYPGMVINRIFMKTMYPGLLIGAGNPHGTSKSALDIKCGFSFNYVTGQPYIPGSSVKGMLRSYFEKKGNFIIEILNNVTSFKDWNSDLVISLKKNIFENNDIFFDAVIFDSNKYGKIMGPDYITPHKDVIDEPVPIYILKILPDVKLEFRFVLSDFKKDDTTIITATEKEKLFVLLLELFGIGAKNNVGYGALESCKPERCEKVVTKNNSQSNMEKNNKNKVVCPDCGIVNYRFKPSGKEQWESWPNCRKCRRKLI